jgi:hypothetical protein
MEFPLDEKGIFDIFHDIDYVRPHKGALVFPSCDTVLVQYEANKTSTKASPGFLVCLHTEPGQNYILETNGFLHEGKKAFIYGDARREGFTGPTGSTGSTGSTGNTGECCLERLIPREYFFQTCDTSSFKIPFTAINFHTEVGILFFCNTMDYCLSICQFRVYKTGGCYKLDCYPCGKSYRSYPNDLADDGYSLTNTNHCGKCDKCGGKGCSACKDNKRDRSHKDKDKDKNRDNETPCSSSKWKEPCCPALGPVGATGATGTPGTDGRSGTRTYCLDIARSGYSGKTLPMINCSGNIFFLETANGKPGCCKLWQCDGTQFQWITPSPPNYIYYDIQTFQIWIVEGQTCTLLIPFLGDLAFDSNSGQVFVGNSKGQWIYDGCNLKGPTGNTGPTGPSGLQGSKGPSGPTGPTGSDSGITTQSLNPNNFVITLNDVGSLTNVINMTLAAPQPLINGLTRTAPDALNPTNDLLELQIYISDIVFASAAVPGNLVSPGQFITGVISINVSNLLTALGYNSSFQGTSGNKITVQAQIQQDDASINTGYASNVYTTLVNNANILRCVIVMYNTTANTVAATTFKRTLALSLTCSGSVLPL